MSHRIAALTCLAVFAAQAAMAQWTWTPQTGRWINVKRMPKETAELQLEYARSLMLEGDYKKALRETNKFVEFYSDTDLADENQFLRGEIRLAQGKWLDAARDFQQVVSSYPDTELYNESIEKQYEIGDRFYAKGVEKRDRWYKFFEKRPLRRAIEVYGMVVENQPFTPEAAQAQYKIGLSHYAREEYLEAAYEYRRVVEDYSGSDWVDEASYGMAKCYVDASLPPDYDQTPSELAVDAIDTFIERYPEDERVAELKDERAEMRATMARHELEVAKFYEKRREFSAARIYYEMVLERYADTDAAATAQAWLEEHAGVTHVGITRRRDSAEETL